MKNDWDRNARSEVATRARSAPGFGVWLALAMSLLVGLAARQIAYAYTGSIRFELNQVNSFYWGDRIVHGTGEGANAGPGAADWRSFWRSYVAIYETDEAQRAPDIHTLDYVPLRLLMAGVWVNYLNFAYGPVSQWRPEFARSFAAFSMVMELAGAAAMFALVAHWLRPSGSEVQRGVGSKQWGRWEHAAIAAMLVWLNPAAIVDSHIWPHGQTWILPFYLFAILAMVKQRYFTAGIFIGIGAMFKGQMMLVAPMLILWPLFDRRCVAAARVSFGMLCGVGVIVWPWLDHGSMAWARSGFASHGIYSDVLRKGQSLNVPSLLAHVWHMTLHQHVIELHLLGIHQPIELRTLLMAVYAVLLVCCSWGVARQARARDRRLLISIAAPWALMFFILGQMDERYLVWSACFSAGAVAVNRRSLAAYAILSWAGATTMIEFLLICQPKAFPDALQLLARLNPATWLLTGIAVLLLLFETMRTSARQERALGEAIASPAPPMREQVRNAA